MEKDIVTNKKKITILIVSLAAIVVLFNFNYFSQQVRFLFTGKKSIFVENQDLPTKQLPANTLVIETLNIQTPVVYVNDNKESVFQDALQHGVVHYPGTAKVGEYGNAYIFGHSSDYAWAKGDYKTVFALLPEIEIGAEVLVSNEVGETFKYKVTQKFVADLGDVHLLSQDMTKKQLTIQTSYPIGTALKRYIVIAESVEGTNP
jgi:LPXTG-site transpeptidase (sortase) family protein